MGENPWEILHGLARDERGRAALVAELSALGFISPDTSAAMSDNRTTPNERTKALVDIVAALPEDIVSCVVSEGLQQLRDICQRSHQIRLALNQPQTWREVFATIGLPLTGPVSVEPVQPPGRCNFVYRVRDSRESYVVRYHDPIGRDFLQRHRPERAVFIYCAAAELFRTCITPKSVIAMLFPRMEPTDFSETHSPDTHTDLLQTIIGRIIVHPDYIRTNHCLLTQYDATVSEPDPAQWTALFIKPIAELHAASFAISSRAQQNAADDLLASKFQRYLPYLRFRTSTDYFNWLQSPNWISRRILSALNNHSKLGSVWPTILARLSISSDQILHHCHCLWRHSAQYTEKHGSLVHLDHNPRNCFINRSTLQVVIFDFDYIAVADPAYDIGLACHSFLRFIFSKTDLQTNKQAIALVDEFFRCYTDTYTRRRPDIPTEEVKSLILRARSFAGLTMSVVLHEDLPKVPMHLGEAEERMLAQRLESCVYLLQSLTRFDHDPDRNTPNVERRPNEKRTADLRGHTRRSSPPRR